MMRLFERYRLWPRYTFLVLGAAAIIMALGIFLLVHSFYQAEKIIPPAPLAVVEITPSGFDPSTLDIKSGTKVVWVNFDQAPHQIAADPYPTHSELTALVAPKALGYKQTYSFIFTKVRTIHYYDEINPTWQGSIEVQP
jgi:plastocyanin